MKAMILAAGAGTRLRPLTLAVAKPMVPVVNVPLLERTVGLLHRQGVSELAVNLHYLPESIEAHFGESLTYSHEPTLLGTAGGVKRLGAFFDATFLVLYGDNLYDFELAPLVAFHRKHGALATLATFTTPDPTACGLVVTDSHGRVTRFQEKPPAAEVFTDQANAGVYVLEPEVLALIPENTPYDFGHDLFPRLLTQHPSRVVALPLGGYLRDTGTPENYRQANWDLLARGEPAIHPTARIHPTATLVGRNVIGAGCVVAAHAHLEECLLWPGTAVAEGTSLKDVLLGANGATLSL